jgi:hypothetical protein
MSAMSFPASMEMLAGDIVALCIALVQSLEFRFESVLRNSALPKYPEFWEA